MADANRMKYDSEYEYVPAEHLLKKEVPKEDGLKNDSDWETPENLQVPKESPFLIVEMVQNIAKYLDCTDLQNFATTCSYIHNAIPKKKKCVSVYIGCRHAEVKTSFCNLNDLRKYQHIDHLTIHGCGWTLSQIYLHLDSFPKLKSLKIIRGHGDIQDQTGTVQFTMGKYVKKLSIEETYTWNRHEERRDYNVLRHYYDYPRFEIKCASNTKVIVNLHECEGKNAPGPCFSVGVFINGVRVFSNSEEKFRYKEKA